MYQVIDKHTGQLVGKPSKTLRAASKKVDRLDNAYGGCRYFHQEVPTTNSIDNLVKEINNFWEKEGKTMTNNENNLGIEEEKKLRRIAQLTESLFDELLPQLGGLVVNISDLNEVLMLIREIKQLKEVS